MPFKKIDEAARPARQWSIVGYPGSGKSTFAAQMAGPLLAVDSDGRFVEAVGPGVTAYTLDDNHNAENIVNEIRRSMLGSGVKTIVVDSLTSIITPLVVAAILGNDAGRNKNRVSAFKAKALAVRLLQDAVTSAGVDTLWVYHLRDGMDAKAKAGESTSISVTELSRLRRSLNMQLRIVQDGNRRGMTVEWARRGRQGVTLWDDTTHWAGMPEKIEKAVYAGLSAEDMDATEKGTPKAFAGPEDAIAWGWESGPFRDARHAKLAYDKLRTEQQPKSAANMWLAWIADVERRLAEMEGEPA
jgi:hypothetical protein